jgi:hypothetical protein
MAFSWGGFARSLSDRMNKANDMAAEEAAYSRRKKMEMELEKQYGAEVVSRTAVEGNEEVSYNKYGDKIRSRLLTAEELAERQAALDKTLADARKSKADATVSEVQAEYAPEATRLSLDATRTNIAQSQEAIATSRTTRNLAQRRFDVEVGNGNVLPKELQAAVDDVRVMIHTLNGDGVNTAEGLEKAFEAELNAAIVKKDIDEARRVIARYKGQLNRPFTRAKTEDTTRASGGLDGFNMPPPPGG